MNGKILDNIFITNFLVGNNYKLSNNKLILSLDKI